MQIINNSRFMRNFLLEMKIDDFCIWKFITLKILHKYLHLTYLPSLMLTKVATHSYWKYCTWYLMEMMKTTSSFLLQTISLNKISVIHIPVYYILRYISFSLTIIFSMKWVSRLTISLKYFNKIVCDILNSKFVLTNFKEVLSHRISRLDIDSIFFYVEATSKTKGINMKLTSGRYFLSTPLTRWALSGLRRMSLSLWTFLKLVAVFNQFP